MSIQWDVNGYFYPIQIAQFGLAHYSKYFSEGEPARVILEDGDENRGEWTSACEIVPDPSHDEESRNHVAVFQHFPECKYNT